MKPQNQTQQEIAAISSYIEKALLQMVNLKINNILINASGNIKTYYYENKI